MTEEQRPSLVDSPPCETPSDDPDAKYKAAARELAADALLEAFAGPPPSGGEIRFVKTPSWLDLKHAAEAEAREEQVRHDQALLDAAPASSGR